MPLHQPSGGDRAVEPVEREGRPSRADRSGSGLVLAGVSKRWVQQRRTALHDVDLSVGRGLTAAVVGANGSGKTTMLRVITGLIKPDSGTVSLNGVDSERGGARYRSQIGFLPAGNSGLFARLSVRRHLKFAAQIALLPRSDVPRSVDRALEAFALGDLAPRRVDRLSLGQRQRLRAALAFLHQPELVLLDEPETSLDEHGVLLLREAVRDLTARGGIGLWCTPALNDGGGSFDRTFVMDAGRLRPG